MILSLMLWSGRRVVGPVIDRLPGGSQLLLHRYIIAVHFAGLLLAGIGAVWAFRRVVPAGALRVQIPVPDRWLRSCVACGLAFWAMYPVLGNRTHYAEVDTPTPSGTDRRRTDVRSGGHLAHRRPRSSGAAGGSTRACSTAGARPARSIRSRCCCSPCSRTPMRSDSPGASGRSAPTSRPRSTPTTRPPYDLFNVKYVLLGNGSQPAVPATLIGQRRRLHAVGGARRAATSRWSTPPSRSWPTTRTS